MLGRPTLIPPVTAQVILQVTMDAVQVTDETTVAGQRVQSLNAHLGQQLLRITARAVPKIWVYRPEDLHGFLVPTPAQVARQVSQRTKGFRKNRLDNETSDRSHAIQVTETVAGWHLPAMDTSVFRLSRLLEASNPATVGA